MCRKKEQENKCRNLENKKKIFSPKEKKTVQQSLHVKKQYKGEGKNKTLTSEEPLSQNRKRRKPDKKQKQESKQTREGERGSVARPFSFWTF
jgi:hypothetical protein